jgi:hypothetical protein
MTEAGFAVGLFFAAGEFRIGSVLNRTWSVFSRNFLAFFVVMAIASLPDVLLSNAGESRSLVILGAFVSDVMRRLSQAVVLYSAFQDMRGNAMLVIATYHELRVIKEGVDTEQIAAVFE